MENFQRNAILVLSNSKDGIHTDEVIKELVRLGERVFRLDSDSLSKGEIGIEFFASDDAFFFKLHNKEGDEILHSEEIKSVWYRRPNVFEFEIEDIQQKKFAELELKDFLEGLWLALDEKVYWMSHPLALQRARRKILQLKLAREIGFHIPDTVTTNMPETVRTMAARHEELISKPMNQAVFEYGETTYSSTTTVLTDEHLEKIDLIKNLPTTFQEHIHKTYELRITVIGNDVYAIKIDSQSRPETSIDWRNILYIDEIPHELVVLPENIHTKCLEITHRLGLNYGAIDMIVNTLGEYIFLEINPNGQWYWLEDLTNVPLTKRIAQELARAGK